jgi:mono/diheme cytochrome c family protein
MRERGTDESPVNGRPDDQDARAGQRRRTKPGLVRRGVMTLFVLGTGCEPAPRVDSAALSGAVVPAGLERGRGLFDMHCASCHGPMALGTDQGPPLVHSVYRPAHHGDEAFQLAVSQGVRAHHWRFGDMPAVPGLTRRDVQHVIGYVRWLQRTAGVE